MMDKSVTDKFAAIVENLERLTDINRRQDMPARDVTPEDIALSCRQSGCSEWVSLEYFRMSHVLAWREMFGADAPRMAYSAGKKVGAKLDVSCVQDLIDAIARMGIARAEVSTMSDGETGREKIVILFNKPVVSSGMAFIGEPVCHFEGGLLAGALEKIYRRTVTVTETSCAAAGGKVCRFETDFSDRYANAETADESALCTDYSEENIQLFTTLAAHALTTLQNAKRYERAKKMTIMDPLTKTYNCSYFHARIKEEIQRSERLNKSFCLVMVDLDGFKGLNDRFGHPTGDRVLKEVARIIKENIRGIDILCRYGGDEFLIVFPQTDRMETIKVVERMRGEIEHRDFGLPGKHTVPLRITASFGCAIYPLDGCYPEQLVELADKALYNSKRAGRNQLKFSSECKVCEQAASY